MPTKNLKIETVKTLLSIAALIFIPLWTACNNQPLTKGTKYTSIEPKPVNYILTLKLIKSIEIDIPVKSIFKFGRVQGQKKKLYLYNNGYDGANSLVLIFNLQLEEIGRHIIPRGQGPGDGLKPQIIGGDKERICVFDSASSKIMFYSPLFKYLNETRFYNNDLSMDGAVTFLPKHQSIVDCLSYHISTNQKAYYMNVNTISKMEQGKGTRIIETRKTIFDNQKRLIEGNPVHFLCQFDSIYILDKRDYRLLKTNMKGKPIKAISMKFKSRTFSEKERLTWSNSTAWNNASKNKCIMPEKLWPAGWVMRMGDGIIVVRYNNFNVNEKIDHMYADYFDRDLNYLGQIQLPIKLPSWNHPVTGSLIADTFVLYRDGFLYKITFNSITENAILEKYDVGLPQSPLTPR